MDALVCSGQRLSLSELVVVISGTHVQHDDECVDRLARACRQQGARSEHTLTETVMCRTEMRSTATRVRAVLYEVCVRVYEWASAHDG